IGLTNSAAYEGAELGIKANGVFPLASTRTNAGLGERDAQMGAWMEHFTPIQVAETVVYLCSPTCELNGELFGSGGGRVSRIGIYGGTGYRNVDLTAEDLAAHIAEARDMTD